MGESGKGVRVEGEEKWKDEIEAEKGFFSLLFPCFIYSGYGSDCKILRPGLINITSVLSTIE